MFSTVKKKFATMSIFMFLVVMSIAGSAFATTPPAVDTTDVTDTFSSMTTTVLTVIAAVAASAVTVMGIILAWKYGRKLFGMLAK